LLFAFAFAFGWEVGRILLYLFRCVATGRNTY
jgi:hypothetical protein